MSDTVRRTNKVLVVLVVLVVRTNFRCVDNNTLIKLCQAFSVFFLTFLFLCVTILYYFITSRVLMNNTNTTKITVFITVALKKALPKISGMPYFIGFSTLFICLMFSLSGLKYNLSTLILYSVVLFCHIARNPVNTMTLGYFRFVLLCVAYCKNNSNI